MPKLKISLFSLLLIPVIILDPSGEIAATVLAATAHEIGHLAVIIASGIGIKELRVTPYGLEIGTVRKYRSFSEEIAVSCAGCAVNFISFLLFSQFTGFAVSFSYASVTLGILNALPVLSLDGGEALHAVFSALLPYKTAERLSYTVSFITLLAMWIIAAYIFLFSGYNYSLFIMSVWLFGKIYCGRS